MKNVEVKFIQYDYWNNEEIAPSINSALAIAKEGFFNYCEVGDSNNVILLFTRSELDNDIQQQLKSLDIDDDDDEETANLPDVLRNGGEFIVGDYKFIYNN